VREVACANASVCRAWPGGHVTSFDARYLDIVPIERIVYAIGMHLDDIKIPVSLATIEFKAESFKARLIVTVKGAFLDGYDNAVSREHGARALVEKLAGRCNAQPPVAQEIGRSTGVASS
jgi:uncharacterized protein YndB with AHSA1/START domain